MTARKSPRRAQPNARKSRPLLMERLESRAMMANDTLQPLAGDFNADGIDTPGLFDSATKQFFLRDANTPGFPQAVFSHPGLTVGVPVAGDWNGNDIDTVGLFDPATKTFRLALHNSPSAAVKTVRITNAHLGGIPVVGDWDGDGTDGIGVYIPHLYRFYLKNTLTTGKADLVFGFFPTITAENKPNGYHFPEAWRPVAGKFVPEPAGDQRETVGLLQTHSRQLYIAKTPGARLYRQFQLGPAPTRDAVVITGDWDGSNDDSIGYWDKQSAVFRERNWLTSNKFDQELYVPPSTTTAPTPGIVTTGVVKSNPRIVATRLGSTTIANQNTFAPLLSEGTTTSDAAAAMLASLNPNDLAMAHEVEQLLSRAAAATPSEDAIIAIVDRGGRILGVRVEQGVLNQYAALYPNPADRIKKLVFAIDGAVAKARTAASFANGDGALDPGSGFGPLTTRTIRSLSQSTITEREMRANPNAEDIANKAFADTFNSPNYGPGWIAPVGLGGHFPPDVSFTPHVDLFHIEHQGRDSTVHPGLDGVKGTADDILLPGRFNVAPAFGPLSELSPPDSYGFVSGLYKDAQGRGFATMPGGIPLYKDRVFNDGIGDTLVGGIGVFFPGPDGTAGYEQNFIPGQSAIDRLNAPKAREAEFIAFAAQGSNRAAAFYSEPRLRALPLGGVAPVPGYDLPFGRIDLVGITLEVVGPNPTQQNPLPGPIQVLNTGLALGVGQGNPNSGQNMQVTTDPNVKSLDGKTVPEGWLVLPQASGSLSVADVEQMVYQAIGQAVKTRAAIRLTQVPGNQFPQPGLPSQMVISVADTDGKVLGIFRMRDATIFSIDVSVTKARNTAYYSDPTALQPEDFVDDDLLRPDLLAAVAGELNPNGLGNPDIYADKFSTIPFDDSRGLAFTNRTFRYLAEPRFPSGQDGTVPPVFSILTDAGINIITGETLRPNGVNPVLIPAKSFNSVAGFDAFHAGRNFHDPDNIANQNGIVFFPGSTPLYEGGVLRGGFGVSGDGVDQDDVVTAAGMQGFAPPLELRADRVFYRGVRLPFQKFNRNPEGF